MLRAVFGDGLSERKKTNYKDRESGGNLDENPVKVM